MNQYDIRKQIQRENRNKLFSEIGLVLFLIVIIVTIIFAGKLPNPLRVLTTGDGKEIVEEYKKGLDYVKVKNASLEFTGYYKEDKDGNVRYNCYSALLGDEKFFVFVPVSRTGDDPAELLTDYSFTARLHTDTNLLSAVAEDYDMTLEEWNDTNIISTIVLDEANLDRTRMLVIWGALLCVIALCAIYLVISYLHLKDIYAREEVKYLSRYGDVRQVLDDINKEVNNNLVFDSIPIKITRNYFIAFTNGKILLEKRKQISEVKLVSKVKKAYGLVKLGYENFLQIIEDDVTIFEVPIVSEVEAKEIMNIMQ